MEPKGEPLASDTLPVLASPGGEGEVGPTTLVQDGKDADLEKDKVEPLAAAAGSEFPEGGTQAYLAICGACCVLFSMFGLANSFGVLQAHFEDDLLKDRSQSEISWIGSVHFFILFVMSFPSGRIFDRGHFRYQLAIGSVLWLIGVFMFSLAREYYQFFLAWAICMGVGLGIIFAPTLSCVGTYFKRRRATAHACGATLSALGTLLFPIMLNKLIPRIGFPATIRAIGFMHLGLLVIANIVMRPRRLPPNVQPPIIPQVRSFLSEPTTCFTYAAAFCVMCGFFIPQTFVQSFSQQHGASAAIAPYTISILNAGAIPGRFVPGLLSDRYGPINTACFFVFFTGSLIFAMLGATTTGGTVAFLLLYGFFSGAWITIMAPVFMALSAGPEELGARNGVGFVFVSFASLIGPPIAGALIKAAGGEYWGACSFGGLIVLLAFVFMVIARQMRAKNRGTWKV